MQTSLTHMPLAYHDIHLRLLQSHPPYTLISIQANTGTVTGYKAVVSENSVLVLCGDYVKLCLHMERDAHINY